MAGRLGFVVEDVIHLRGRGTVLVGEFPNDAPVAMSGELIKVVRDGTPVLTSSATSELHTARRKEGFPHPRHRCRRAKRGRNRSWVTGVSQIAGYEAMSSWAIVNLPNKTKWEQTLREQGRMLWPRYQGPQYDALMAGQPLRASDSERDAAVQVLNEALSRGASQHRRARGPSRGSARGDNDRGTQGPHRRRARGTACTPPVSQFVGDLGSTPGCRNSHYCVGVGDPRNDQLKTTPVGSHGVSTGRRLPAHRLGCSSRHQTAPLLPARLSCRIPARKIRG